MQATSATFDPDSEASNYVQAYLKAASSDNDAITFDNTQLLATCFDLFTAGSETTSNTIRWAILYLAHHPNVQEKLYQQIKNEVGTDSLPSYADKTKLPLAEAAVMETQRLANLVPMGVPRKPFSATRLLGYDIPENSVILPLLTNILHNPDVFPEPEKFNPYRFLDSGGKVIRDPKMIPFQAGKSSGICTRPYCMLLAFRQTHLPGGTSGEDGVVPTVGWIVQSLQILLS